jgi:protein-S-isoprenylcysteine O-methyltransferase Ste14
MNNDMVFLVLFLATIFIGTGVRRYYQYKIEKNRQKLSVRERIEEMVQAEGKLFTLLLVAQGIYIVISLILYLFFSSSIILSQIPFPVWLRWFGVALGFLSVPFLVWVHYVLDRSWSVTLKLQTNHKLLTSGPYRRIRHPMYAVLIVYMLSWVLISANLLFLVYYILSVFLIVVRIPKEERMMLEKFGEEYRVYMKRTGMLLPHFSQKNVETSKRQKQHYP